MSDHIIYRIIVDTNLSSFSTKVCWSFPGLRTFGHKYEAILTRGKKDSVNVVRKAYRQVDPHGFHWFAWINNNKLEQ